MVAATTAPAIVKAKVVSAAAAGTSAPRAQGAYVVRPGDTLGALAGRPASASRRWRTSTAWTRRRCCSSGTVLKLPNGAPAPAGAAKPAPATRVVPAASPRADLHAPDAQGASSSSPPSTALPPRSPPPIAWQESGFNNSVVSSANARGVMQVMPGTWDWVQKNLASAQLNPASAEDNVRAGSLYLARLLREAGGDARLATAGYYQGLYSVKTRGMYDDTKRYVDNVMALRARFGG